MSNVVTNQVDALAARRGITRRAAMLLIAPRRRGVRFANTLGLPLETVRTVPAGGRGMEPGFLARVTRVRGLALHGILISRHAVDEAFGDGTGPGASGQYTDAMASLDVQHAAAHGGAPWHRAFTVNGHTRFIARYRPPGVHTPGARPPGVGR